ncbi:MAG: proton-conducting transporter membrane subunit, partial [Candidatus Omnitrophica bacterium]|nr:proton-conducting transporter membrane subunit [Candidatus Omnitrophota bacterium]
HFRHHQNKEIKRMSIFSLFVVIPLASAFIIALIAGRLKNIGNFIFCSTTLILCVLSLSAVRLVNIYKVIVFKIGGWLPPVGISMVADGLAVLMLVTVALVAMLVSFYAVRYIQKYTDTWKFHALFMLMLAGINGVILSGDLFNLYVFLELASISAYVLVAFGVEPEGLEAAFRYAVMGSLGSIFVLLGIALLYGYCSTLNMADISLVLSNNPRGVLIGFVSVLFLAGFGLKAALVPFHAWLPDAHSSAPSPVSAMLSGVLIKALGIYAIARIFFNVLGVSGKMLFVLMILGTISMVVGALMAMSQSDLKRMFAYSSISQIGYIALALGVGTPLAIFGGLFHLFNHAVFKSLLFLNAGSIEHATGTRNLKKLGGLAGEMPVEGVTSLVGSMSISGIPPLGGFWSKLIIIIAVAQAGYTGFAAIAVVVSIITLAYYLEFQTFAFFGKLDERMQQLIKVPLAMKLSVISLAGICVFSGLLLLPYFRPFLQSAANVLVSGSGYKDAVFAAIRW